MNKKCLLALMGMTAAGIASAANVNVSGKISSSVTWTADNVYNMTNRTTVMPGATLTIEPGTLIASDGGSLAVTRGAKIIANGTKENPIIFTSVEDDFATWRPSCQEWGSVAILGNGLISADRYKGVDIAVNGTQPDGLATRQMEGLVATNGTDATVLYGGNNDDDDSGSLSYVSFRYGGKVLEEANELNGLSLGGIGRATDIDHVEIMNNVDDGIEIWGGTVNLKYVSIWNIGDDSLDCDQGWRGKAQFGLIVQGYSAEADQGSGMGDNCIEIDGAEDSDAQPVTTSTIYNFTVIGTPVNAYNEGDYATAWRENARVQYRNCIFMDIGDALIKNEKDGDGGSGYNLTAGQVVSYVNGSTTNYNTITMDVPSLQTLFATPYTSYPTNAIGVNQATLYPVQTSGQMAEMSDSVFYNVAVYTEATTYGVVGGYNNIDEPATMPIVKIERAPLHTFVAASKTFGVGVVTNLDPRAAGDAVTSVATAPNDGFFTQAPFRGGFSPNNNWLEGWTAADQFGLTDTSANIADPSATIQMTASTFFPTTAGVVYTVEESSDMKNWAPVATVTGDGSIMSATDLDAFDSAKFYRAIVL